jgi:RNA polymerase sigma-70 factor, ECF subfamily
MALLTRNKTVSQKLGQLSTDIWESYLMALDDVTERLQRIASALEGAGVAYALVGGQAVALWVATKDPSAVRTTKDVDILLRREDLPTARGAAAAAGFDYFEVMGVGMFLDRSDPNPRKAVHILWAGEKFRPDCPLPSPTVEESEMLAPGKCVISLAGLVCMKLMSNRDQDRVHLRDMIDVGLIHRELVQTLPPDLATRLSPLLQRAAAGDEDALRELFEHYRDRLKRMVRLRLSRRLQGRVDDSDVIQEALVDIAKNLADYVREPRLPLFLWMRHMTGLKLTEVHRRHLGTQLRDADREVSLHRGGLPEADSVSLAAQLLGQMTSPSQAAIKAETRIYVQEALNSMDPIDREVLALKHFEQLSTSEIADELGLSKAGAGSRYLRAIKRLRETLSRIPGFQDLQG